MSNVEKKTGAVTLTETRRVTWAETRAALAGVLHD